MYAFKTMLKIYYHIICSDLVSAVRYNMITETANF